MMSLSEVFGHRLKLLLKQHGMTEKELGKRLYCNQQTISHYITGINLPRYEMTLQIADILNTSLDYLFGRSDINNYEKEQLETELVQLLNKIFLAYGFEVDKKVYQKRKIQANKKNEGI